MDTRRDLLARRKSNMGLDLLWQGKADAPTSEPLSPTPSESMLEARESATPRQLLAEAECPTVPWSSVVDPKWVGCGAFADVFLASFEQQKVAVKLLRSDHRDDELARKDLASEAQLLSRLSHTNLPKLYAVGENDGNMFVVMEQLSGSLTNALPPPKDGTPIWTYRAAIKQWPLSRAVRCGTALAEALAFCHGGAIPGVGIMHRDLKPDNIGFAASDGRLILFDFGLAKLLPIGQPESDEPKQMTGETGSTRYMAPEVALCQKYTFSAEVFSWSLILWELAAHEKPFAALTVDGHHEKVARGGARPHLSKSWPASLCALFTECWEASPPKRPTFAQLVPRMHAIVKEVEEAEAQKPAGDGSCCSIS